MRGLCSSYSFRLDVKDERELFGRMNGDGYQEVLEPQAGSFSPQH